MRVFSGLIDAYYCVTYFVFRRNIRGYELTLMIDVNYRSFKCVDVTFQIDKNFCAKDLDQVLYYKIDSIIDLYANDVNYDA